jgi:hypothetical protein
MRYPTIDAAPREEGDDRLGGNAGFRLMSRLLRTLIRAGAWGCVALIVMHGAIGHAQDLPTQEKINNWLELRTALRRCWDPPTGTEGSFISFRFGLTKDGAIRGAPMVTATHLVGSEEARNRFREAAFEALRECFPAPLTKEFGALMSQNPIILSFADMKRELPLPFPVVEHRSSITVFSKD